MDQQRQRLGVLGKLLLVLEDVGRKLGRRDEGAAAALCPQCETHSWPSTTSRVPLVALPSTAAARAAHASANAAKRPRSSDLLVTALMCSTCHLLLCLCHTTPSTLHWKGALPALSLGHHRATSPVSLLELEAGEGGLELPAPGREDKLRLGQLLLLGLRAAWRARARRTAPHPFAKSAPTLARLHTSRISRAKPPTPRHRSPRSLGWRKRGAPGGFRPTGGSGTTDRGYLSR